MNHTTNSIKSYLTGSQQSKKSFRVLVKNRITHENAQPQTIKNTSQVRQIKNNTQEQNFQEAKNNLKKYIKNMKSSAKSGQFRYKTDSSRYQNKNESQINSKITSSRKNLISSRKVVLNSQSTNGNYKKQLLNEQILHNNSAILSKTKFDSIQVDQNFNKMTTQHNSPGFHSSLFTPVYPLKNQQINAQQDNQQVQKFFSPHAPTSERQRLAFLQKKIQDILQQKLKVIAKESFNTVTDNKNFKVGRLLQKQMDKIMQQIRKIKSNQLNQFQNPPYILIEDHKQKDNQMNKNIQMLQKKVKILQRLIAEKLFQSDNIKNRYLKRLKQHKRNQSEIPHSRNSKSNTFYRQANTLNPSNFKPLPIRKQALITSDQTTNRVSFQKPLNSYYIVPRKQTFYNNNKLTQPLNRSTYDRQYLIYGALPRSLITVKSHKKDHAIFNGKLSQNQQKNMLNLTTYKEDFIKKIERQPINFKELDCYKDKFKDIQVNYGKQKNNNKVVNDQTINQFRNEQQYDNPQDNEINRQKILPMISPRSLNNEKFTNSNFRTPQAHRTISHLLQTEQKISNFEQQQIQKYNLFNQRIRSQIKHKNVYDQKYMFKKQLLNEMNRSIKQIKTPLITTQKVRLTKTIQN